MNVVSSYLKCGGERVNPGCPFGPVTWVSPCASGISGLTRDVNLLWKGRAQGGSKQDLLC